MTEINERCGGVLSGSSSPESCLVLRPTQLTIHLKTVGTHWLHVLSLYWWTGWSVSGLSAETPVWAVSLFSPVIDSTWCDGSWQPVNTAINGNVTSHLNVPGSSSKWAVKIRVVFLSTHVSSPASHLLPSWMAYCWATLELSCCCSIDLSPSRKNTRNPASAHVGVFLGQKCDIVMLWPGVWGMFQQRVTRLNPLMLHWEMSEMCGRAWWRRIETCWSFFSFAFLVHLMNPHQTFYRFWSLLPWPSMWHCQEGEAGVLSGSNSAPSHWHWSMTLAAHSAAPTLCKRTMKITSTDI